MFLLNMQLRRQTILSSVIIVFLLAYRIDGAEGL